MTLETLEAEAHDPARRSLPYKQSWANLLAEAIDRLPGPAAISYLALGLLLALSSHVLRWADGSIPFGAWDPIRIAETSLVVLPIALLHYLGRHARRAFELFRPALEDGDATSDAYPYRLSVAPAKGSLIVSVISVPLALLSLSGDPDGYGLNSGSSAITIVYTAGIACFSFAAIGILLFQSLRQLRLVNQLYALATNISLFHPRPIHAFSTLTARTGISFLLFGYIGVFVIWTANISSPTPMSLQDLGIFVFVALIAVASFVVPLLGIHNRLDDEKDRLLAQVNQRIQSILGTLHSQIDDQDLQRMDNINHALASLIAERELLNRVATWPWKPETLRGFVSAVALPVIVWLVTTLLGRVLGP